MRAYAYTLVTTSIVLVFALAEWGAERFISERSRAASTAVEIAIVIIAALVFRPVHQRVDQAIEAAFNKKKRQALAALAKLRRELTSFGDAGELQRRVIEAVGRHMEARACAVYVRRDVFRAEASSFDVSLQDVPVDDPLAIRLHAGGTAVALRALRSAAAGSCAFPMTAAGDLIGFVTVDSAIEYDADELQMLGGLAQDLAVALGSLDPQLRPRTSRTPNNIPANLLPLIGRERELADLRAALAESHLVTLTGPGGVGKTSLALRCAADMVDRRVDGAWFVNLAPIANGALVAATALATIGGGGDHDNDLDSLIEHLRLRDAFIVLDNCEQVLTEVSQVASRVHASCPGVSLLLTSREVLHLEGEHIYRLGSLQPPAAAELFEQCAADAAGRFDPNIHARAVTAICERLDGIPLAIELAAARANVLAPDEILERLRERFRLLTGGSRDALPRQRTLAATIEWSYDLLEATEQSLFRRLAVFRGSFTLGAAAAVCAEGGVCDEYRVLDALTSLADKSLVSVTTALSTRYRLLETIREFAEEKSRGSHDAASSAAQHAAFFAALASQAYHEFDSQLPPGWLEKLAPDLDNFREALTWLLDGPGDRGAGAQAAADCGPMFMRLDLLSEGLQLCERARAVTGLVPATAGRVEYVASMMHNNLGENREALACAQRAVALLQQTADERGLVRALSQVAQQLARAQRFEEARAPAAEAIRRARLLGEPRVLIGVLRRCAFSLPAAAIADARVLFSEALETARSARDPEEACIVLEWWATREAAAGSYERAKSLALEGLECAGRNAQMSLEIQLAAWILVLGDPEEAGAHAREALALAARTQNPLARATALAYYAPLHAARDPREAAMLFGYASKCLERLEWDVQPDDGLALKNAAHAIEDRLADGEFKFLLERGGGWNEEDALAVIARSFSTAPEN
jgi:predicted ATPase